MFEIQKEDIMKRWTEEEINLLKSMNNPQYTLKDISNKLNKSKETIQYKIKTLGLSYNYKKEHGNYNDIIGNKYGHLEILDFVKRENKANYYLCKCDCGNIKVVDSRRLLYGDNKNITCGCNKWKRKNKIDMVGKRFGRLTVLRETEERKAKEIVWECLCDCGNIYYATGYNLRTGHTNSCGCFMRERVIDCNKKYNKYDLESFPWGVGWTSNTDEIFIFDKEDFDKIKDYCWSLDAYGYVVTRINGKTVKLHRIIMEVNDPHIFVDHIKHDKRDNRKNRMRLVTNQQNTKNRIPKNKSGVSGVNYDENRGKWVAQITHNYKNIHIGVYDSKEDAIEARLKANEKYCGEYSYEKSMVINKEVA